MSDDFAARLQTIVDQSATDFRAEAQRDVALLLQSGADSYERLMLIAGDQNQNGNVRAAAFWALTQLGEGERALLVLLAALNDQSVEARREAARSLGIIGNKRAVQPLIKLLSDTSSEVRAAAAYALGLLGHESALDPLVNILKNKSEEEKVRGIAAEALADMRDKRAVPALLEALEDEAVGVRFWSAFALGEIGDPQAVPALSRLAATDEAELPGWRSVKEEAAKAIQRIAEQSESRDRDS